MRRSVRSSIVGATCLTNCTRRAPRRPEPQREVGHVLRHRGAGQRAEVGGEVGGLGDDVDRAQQRRRDRAQLVDPPVGADAAAVAGERRRRQRRHRPGTPRQSSPFCPSVSRMACRTASGCRSASWRASVSQAPIAVPPLARSWPTRARRPRRGSRSSARAVPPPGTPARRRWCRRSPRTRHRRAAPRSPPRRRRAERIWSPPIDPEHVDDDDLQGVRGGATRCPWRSR